MLWLWQLIHFLYWSPENMRLFQWIFRFESRVDLGLTNLQSFSTSEDGLKWFFQYLKACIGQTYRLETLRFTVTVFLRLLNLLNLYVSHFSGKKLRTRHPFNNNINCDLITGRQCKTIAVVKPSYPAADLIFKEKIATLATSSSGSWLVELGRS